MHLKVDDKGVVRVVLPSMDDLSESGVLWYLNRVAFHPRGLALAFGEENGEFVVELWGNGNEPWNFSEEDDNDRFIKFEATLDLLRRTVQHVRETPIEAGNPDDPIRLCGECSRFHRASEDHVE